MKARDGGSINGRRKGTACYRSMDCAWFIPARPTRMKARGGGSINGSRKGTAGYRSMDCA